MRTTKWTWTKERVDELRRMHKARMTAQAIADHFGTYCSRNAVLGKLFRLGLCQARPTERWKAEVSRRAMMIRKAKRNAEAKLKQGHKRKSAVVFEADDWKPQPEAPPANLIGLADLAPDACRWPYGDGPFLFGCPCSRVPGLPYCETHVRRAYVAPEPKRRPPAPTAPAYPETAVSDAVRGGNGHSTMEMADAE